MSDFPDYLEGALRGDFDRWLEATVARHCPPLEYRELRRGVQALSSLYVERRAEGRLAERSVEGTGKRAAFASFFSALHFVCSHQLVRQQPAGWKEGISEIFDLGCGAGATGAGVATALEPRPKVRGFDRSGWALREARHCYRAFDLEGHTRRADIGSLRFPRGGRPLALAGWSVNELEEDSREALLQILHQHARETGPVLVLEPLAGVAVPWWDEWCAAFQKLRARDGIFKWRHRRAAWIRQMDKAAGLDHEVLGARWLAVPGPEAEPREGGDARRKRRVVG